MTERRYHPTVDRQQQMLLPNCVEDYVSAHNPVRAIDAFVNYLDLQQLGFQHAQPSTGSGVGQPAYDPAVLLKLYLYGYQQRIHSSRRLECEARRNMELIWLCQGCQPSYKTISDFRKNNIDAVKAVHREFIQACRALDLLGGECVAIDGTFMKGNASVSGMYTEQRLEKELAHLDAQIDKYHRELEAQDAIEEQTGDTPLSEDPDLADKLERLKEQQAAHRKLQEQLEESGEKQVSVVDEDARMLRKNGKTVGGFNVQSAVDDKNSLIVAAEVTQDGNDTGQLSAMMSAAAEVFDDAPLKGLADSGYYNGEELKACEDQGHTVYVPIPKPKGRKSKRIPSRDFEYDHDQDVYRCPQGRTLTLRSTVVRGDKRYGHYRSAREDCDGCAVRERCLAAKCRTREVDRWEHAEVMDRHRERMAESGSIMRRRGALVEHPFGTLKRWGGMDHFLMRGLDKCRGELSLMVLGYNFKRVLNIIGAQAFREYCLQNQQIALSRT